MILTGWKCLLDRVVKSENRLNVQTIMPKVSFSHGASHRCPDSDASSPND